MGFEGGFNKPAVAAAEKAKSPETNGKERTYIDTDLSRSLVTAKRLGDIWHVMNSIIKHVETQGREPMYNSPSGPRPLQEALQPMSDLTIELRGAEKTGRNIEEFRALLPADVYAKALELAGPQ